MEFPPLVQSTQSPLVASTDWFVLPRALSELAGRGRVRDAVPDDATRHEVESIWVPVWRVDAKVHGMSVMWSDVVDRSGPDVIIQGGPDPDWPPGRGTQKRRRRMGAALHHTRETKLVAARRGFPITPSMEIRVADLAPCDLAALDAPHVEPDLAREPMEKALLAELQPMMGTAYVDDARLCFVPLFVQRYRTGDDPEIYWAAVDGFRGKVVSESAPTLAKRMRRYFT